jgi:hypothetical protein
MRRLSVVIVAAVVLAGAEMALAQGVHVYPSKGQSQRQQDIDTAECTRWAKAQSGVDPNAPAQPAQPGEHARGTVRGGAKGAAVGAAAGAIGGNAGKGAAAGAVVGGVAGRHRSKVAKQANQDARTDSYDRAFAACMDGRGYSVK